MPRPVPFRPLPSYADAVLALSPVGYWPLGEASGTVARDLMNRNPGTYVGSPTLGAAGLLTGDPSTAVTLVTASSQQIFSLTVTLGQSGWSMAGWVKADNGSNASKPVFGKWAINDGAFIYCAGDGKYNAFNGADSIAAAVGPSGAWQFIAATWNASAGLTLYVDNVAVNRASAGAPGVNGYWRIGCSTGVTTFFGGTFAHVTLWDRALTPAEVYDLWRIGMGR